MRILDNNQSLQTYLLSVHNKNITLVTAFASGTEDILSNILENNNTVEILVGTINAFTSPKFIEYCLLHKDQKLTLLVDFRYQNSIHWKLCLINPNIIAIGSANFTITGLALNRDTCIVIEDDNLYNLYMDRYKILIQEPRIKTAHERGFNAEFVKYKNLHNKNQAALARSGQYESLKEWLEDESNQSIPFFVWENQHTEETKKIARDLIKNENKEDNRSHLRDFFTYPGKHDLPYRQGDIVLCANKNGSHLDFYTFDRIIIKDRKYYMYSYRQKTYQRPFEVKKDKRLRQALGKLIMTYYKQRISTGYIQRADLLSLLMAQGN